MFGHKSRVTLAVSEGGSTPHTSSECPDFFLTTFSCKISRLPFSQFLFQSLPFSLFLVSVWLGLQCVDSVFKIIPDLLTLQASTLLLLLHCHYPLLLPLLFLSHIRLNAGQFLVHMAIASIEGTWGADPQHGAVVVHSTEAELFWEPWGYVGHHPGRGRCGQV